MGEYDACHDCTTVDDCDQDQICHKARAAAERFKMLSSKPDRGIADVAAHLSRLLAAHEVDLDGVDLVFMCRDPATEHQIHRMFLDDRRIEDLFSWRTIRADFRAGVKFMALNIRISTWPKS